MPDCQVIISDRHTGVVLAHAAPFRSWRDAMDSVIAAQYRNPKGDPRGFVRPGISISYSLIEILDSAECE